MIVQEKGINYFIKNKVHLILDRRIFNFKRFRIGVEEDLFWTLIKEGTPQNTQGTGALYFNGRINLVIKKDEAKRSIRCRFISYSDRERQFSSGKF